jgi:hypothetical protein
VSRDRELDRKRLILKVIGKGTLDRLTSLQVKDYRDKAGWRAWIISSDAGTAMLRTDWPWKGLD